MHVTCTCSPEAQPKSFATRFKSGSCMTLNHSSHVCGAGCWLPTAGQAMYRPRRRRQQRLTSSTPASSGARFVTIDTTYSAATAMLLFTKNVAARVNPSLLSYLQLRIPSNNPCMLLAGTAAGQHGGKGVAAAAARPGLPQHQHLVPGSAGEALQGAAFGNVSLAVRVATAERLFLDKDSTLEIQHAMRPCYGHSG